MMNHICQTLSGIACILLVLLLTRCSEHGEKVSIDYPPRTPGNSASVFLPGVVSTDSLEFGSAFSPDGKSFYFARSVNKKSKIHVTHHNGKEWSPAVVAEFVSSAYAEADPAFSPDGKFYFISNRPVDESDTESDYDIWFVAPLEDGGWTSPINLREVNSDSSEYYISFSENGNIYFASGRQGGFGEEDIYRSRMVKGKFETPGNLGAVINSERSEYDPAISSEETLLVFTSSKRDDTYGGADLYYSKLGDDGAWKPTVHLDSTFNTKTREYCPYFSPDFKFLFFSSEGNVKWIPTDALKENLYKLKV